MATARPIATRKSSYRRIACIRPGLPIFGNLVATREVVAERGRRPVKLSTWIAGPRRANQRDRISIAFNPVPDK